MSASIHAPFVLVCCNTVEEIIIWSPAELANLLTHKQMSSLYFYGYFILMEREKTSTHWKKRHKLSKIRILIPEQNTTSYLPTLVGKHNSQIFLVVCHQFCIHIGRHFGAHLYRNSLNPLVFLAAKWQPEHSAPSTDFSIGLRSGDCLTTPWLWVLLL